MILTTVAAFRLILASVLVAAIAPPTLASSARSSAPTLHRVYAPGRVYSMLLPPGWHFRNVSYPSDHDTDLWWTPADPLARAVVVRSGCEGCVTSSTGTPHPAGAVTDAVTIHRIKADEVAFTGPYDQAEAGYEDNGIVVVTGSNGRVNGYIRIDLWLPPSEHSLATRILDSFELPR